MVKKMIRQIGFKNKAITPEHYIGLWVFTGVVLANVFLIACGFKNKKLNTGGGGGTTGTGTGSGSFNSGTSDAKSDSDSSGFLKESDFEKEKGALTKEMIMDLLKTRIDQVIQRFNDDLVENECTKKSHKNTKIEPQRISTEGDKIDCEIEIANSDEALQVSIKIKELTTCNKDAFSQIKTKDLLKTDMQELCTEGDLKSLMNMYSKITVKEKSTEVYIAKMTSEGKPCEYSISKSEVTMKDGCMYFENSSGDPEINGPNYSIRATYESVSGEFNRKYFSKGSLDLTINGWKGSIKFGYGEPKYTLTSPKGEKISGSWQDLKKQSGKAE
jgi:hypothetical protein